MKKKVWRNIIFVLMIAIGCLYGDKVYAANHSFITATNISLNQTVTDNLVDGTIGNYYKFTIGSEGIIRIKFSHAELEYDYIEWIVELYDAKREYLMKMNVWGADTDTWSCRYGLLPGEYYIKVLPRSNIEPKEDSYQLTVNHSATNNWETENNDGFTIADSIVPNKGYYGNIAIESDEDYYRISLSKNGYVKVQFKHQQLESQHNEWTITLYDSNRNIVKELYSAGYENSKAVNVGYLSKGNYYLKVEAYNTLSYGFE